jgi:hypothetical protein
MRQLRYSIPFALISLGSVLLAGACTRYILPYPDYRPPGAAQPQVQGRIAAFDGTRLEVAIAAGNTAVVAVSDSTELFTAYGGIVDREELKPGVYVWVWYTHRTASESGNPPRAAIVMPYSLDPNDLPERTRIY